MTPNQLKRNRVYLVALAREHDREAETDVEPDYRLLQAGVNFGGPRRNRLRRGTQKEPRGDAPTLADLWISTKQSKDAPAAPAEPFRKPEGAKATPREAPAAVPATASLVGLTEAALRLDCHRRTVRAYIRAGLLPGLLLAGRWKIRREDLEAFIEAAARARNGLKPRT
jgi:excisionase family DNA binding protein